MYRHELPAWKVNPSWKHSNPGVQDHSPQGPLNVGTAHGHPESLGGGGSATEQGLGLEDSWGSLHSRIPWLFRGQSPIDSVYVSICSEHKVNLGIHTYPFPSLCSRELQENNTGYLSWGEASMGSLKLMKCQKERIGRLVWEWLRWGTGL